MGIDALLRPDPKILVVGGGGREHAVCWRLRRDRPTAAIYCAPGNPGIADVARIVDVDAGDIDELVGWADSEQPDVVVIGPEDPLIGGVVDDLQAIGIAAFGPTRAAAEIEGSKAFSSALVTKLGVPAPFHKTFDDPKAALAYVGNTTGDLVVKADGPALGKGVAVCRSPNEASEAIQRAMVDGAFGASGSRVVIQERLRGPELSLLALSDGKNFRTLGVARDYKPIGEGNTGPNTGGMGSFSPVHDASPELVTRVEHEIVGPVLDGLQREGRRYVGVLYAGLILTDKGPKVIEFNCRMGDPETQAILPVMETDFANLIHAVLAGRIDQVVVEPPTQAAVAVVLASEGYPGPVIAGRTIDGLDNIGHGLIFHAGTNQADGETLTAGGRVVAAVGVGDNIGMARDKAYSVAASVRFEGATYRCDIAADALSVIDAP